MTATISQQADSLESGVNSHQSWVDSLPAFDRAQFASLTTFRRSGVAVMTPVWVARAGQALFIITDADTGKVKRVRHHPAVRIAPSTARGQATGDAVDAVVHVLPVCEDGAGFRALAKKYGWLFGALALWHRVQRKTPVLLELVEPDAQALTRDNP